MADGVRSSEGLDKLLLSATFEAALTLAATERVFGGELRTGPVLSALARVDTAGDWSRLWLHCGFPADETLVAAADDAGADEQPLVTWRNVPLSTPMADALRLVGRLAEAYRLAPIPPGALALALIAVPSGGAGRVLVAGGADRTELLEIVQEDLLGTKLERLGAVLVDLHDLPAAHPQDDIDLFVMTAASDDVRTVLLAAGVETDVLAAFTETARALGTHQVEEVPPGRSSRDVFFDVASRPSLGLRRLLELLGVTGPHLAATVALQGDASRPESSETTYLATVLNYLVLVAMLAILVGQVAGGGSWWALLLTPLVFTGPPQASSWLSALVAIVFWLFSGPELAALKLLETGVSFWRSRTERRDLAAQTGLLLTEAEHNQLLRRQRPLFARLQAIRAGAMLPGRVDRLERAAAAAATGRPEVTP